MCSGHDMFKRNHAISTDNESCSDRLPDPNAWGYGRIIRMSEGLNTSTLGCDEFKRD